MAIKSIGVDIREVHSSGAGKSRYTEELTRALIKIADKDTKFVLYTKKITSLFPAELQVEIPGRSIFWHLNLKRHLEKNPLDLFIAPTSYILPAIAPKGQKIATVVHDLIVFLHPKNHPFFPTLVERLTLGRAIKNSNILITVSNNTKKDLIKIKPEAANKKIITLYPAVTSEFKPTKDKTISLPDKYLLALSTPLPRKNFKRIIEAFKKIDDPDLNLVIVGGKRGKIEADGNILKLGYIGHKLLPEIYSRAQILLFPSLYEGFGIPPLEAMACGCPVITSKTSSLPEVVGDAAIKIDPTSTSELVAAIKNTLKSPEKYREKGLKQAQKFSWEESAAKLLKP
ncbi:glycosyltransferase family 4 protein [Candidatus Peregrinibacteria bacterium]|nr:glycosyltransferase family 4 protein [Candidatus Peregrinibacteria bacterium]MBT4632338.1 glycosyltransferase family 4 protein [Candidatus Peregrinibacteria bacterium]MBT5517128.1 glycosyltransferase family 4 protein [Candidatus Peregrinibacteria bacterium]MBT5824038.1 glycosyltransferase family 4 protein [Candidatus Peregrinibacteria bacterium]